MFEIFLMTFTLALNKYKGTTNNSGGLSSIYIYANDQKKIDWEIFRNRHNYEVNLTFKCLRKSVNKI